MDISKIEIKTGRMHGFRRRRCITVSEHDDIRSISTKSLTFGEEQLFVLRKAHSTGMSVEDNGVCYETDRFIFCKFFFCFSCYQFGMVFFFTLSTYLLPLPYDESLNFSIWTLEAEQTLFGILFQSYVV